MPQRYQVIVVGGGPVGMALAVELGQRGISVCVVERGREVGRLPKGQGLQHRSLEHFYFWHVVDQIRAIRLLPPGYPIGGVNVYGNLLGDYWYPSNASRDKLGPFFFQKNDRLPQYLTEEVLRGRVSELPSVTVLFDSFAKQVEQDESGARVTVADQQWPYEEQVLEGDYLVGCDGTGSIVLNQLGIERHGTDFERRMVLAVIRSPEFHERTKRFGDRTTFHVMNPESGGAWQFWGRVEADSTFFFHAPVAKDTTANDKDYVHGVMQEAAGFDFDVEFQHIGFWSLRISVADTYRKGRIFIAGDAAHSHPPYGGQGLNNGLEDVRNLGWKLAAVLQGWGGDALLDSYSAERQAVFAEIGEDVIAAEIRAEGHFLQQHDPERDREDFEKAWESLAHESAEIGELFEPNYEGSPVVFGPPGGESGIRSHYSLRARAGHHLAPAPLSSGHNVYEELGSGFTLLAFDAGDTAVSAFEEVANELAIPFGVVRDGASGGGEQYEAKLVLVRPDHFVVWTGENADAALATSILRRATTGA